MRRTILALLALWALGIGPGCASRESAPADDDHAHPEGEEHAHGDDDSWSVTAWGRAFEIFAETPPLVAGHASTALTHVTVLDDFSPLREGVVSVVLRDANGREDVFSRHRALRDGIFEVTILPREAGTYALAFRVLGAGDEEEIAAGTVQVGGEDAPAPVMPASATSVEAVPFLKEEQWRTHFATARVDSGLVRESARGTGRVIPASAGELHLVAPVDGIVASDPWPFVGLSRRTGASVFALSSRVSQGRTLAELQALDTERSAELSLARERMQRLEGLLEVGAVSVAEVEAARARVQTLQAQSESVRRQVAAVRGGSAGAAFLEVSAPFDGEVAEVLVAPGQAVSAGDPLARMVRLTPVWIEVQLAPSDARRLTEGVEGIWLRATGDRSHTLFSAPQVRLVAIAPEVDERTGRVACLIEVEQTVVWLRLGMVVEAEVLLARGTRGLVVPASALVDDAGIPTVFVQREGESFERRELVLLGREGERYRVEGLRVGERIVVEGGAAVRRASMVRSGGADHGHVH